MSTLTFSTIDEVWKDPMMMMPEEKTIESKYVNGYDDYNNLYPVDNFYLEDNIYDSKKHIDNDILDEDIPKKIYSNIVKEKEQESKKELCDQHYREQLDLILYVSSGILIILLMNQILNLGCSMR